MKKVILFVLIFATSATAFAQTKGKIGHIDTQAIISKMPEKAGIESKIQEFAKKLETRIQSMSAEYQQKADEYRSQPDMTQTELEAAQRDLAEMEQRIQNAQVQAQEDLQKQQSELLQPMIDKVKKAIEKVGADNGYSYILDGSVGVILYDGGGSDIGTLVEKELGL